ncbi:MAG: hypothetical protein AMXMBFR84_32710 [Candidatus Hydrogenedentota bacterium]
MARALYSNPGPCAQGNPGGNGFPVARGSLMMGAFSPVQNRSRAGRSAVFLVVVWMVALSVSGCTAINIIDRGVWSGDNASVMLVHVQGQVPMSLLESSVGTIDDQMDFITAIVVLGLFSRGNLVWDELLPDLSTAGTLLRQAGNVESGGFWDIQANYYLRARHRAVGMGFTTFQFDDGATMDLPTACMVDLDRDVRINLVPPPAVIASQMNAKSPITNITGAIEAIPSPDGATIGVISYVEDWEAVEWTFFISFFDSATGAHIKTVNLETITAPNYPAPLMPPNYTPPDDEDDEPVMELDQSISFFLWRKDASGVFVLDVACSEEGCSATPDHAWFIPVDPNMAASNVTEVPARAVPTRGGRISDTGLEVVAIGGGEYGIDQHPEFVQHPNWVAFDAIPAIPIAQVDYIADSFTLY